MSDSNSNLGFWSGSLPAASNESSGWQSAAVGRLPSEHHPYRLARHHSQTTC